MIGKTISHYKILEKLGEGGMGVVYKAQDTKLDRFVALKFLPPHLSKTDSDKARFLREAKAAAALNHNNVCTIYEIHDEDENPFIVMEYVEGKTLKEIIKDCQKDPIPISTVIDYTAQIGEALKTAHSKGIVHRDIKAENIMITDTGVVKVMDFGLAKLSGSAQLTKDASTLGTVAYMSPEQIEGKEVDARADIFSFAVVLYEMLSCRMPFKGEYDSATMYAIINEEPEPIQKHRSDLSSEMLHVLNRALEKNPEERYQSVNDMLIDLKRIIKELSSDKTEHLKVHSHSVMKPIWKKPVPVLTGVLAVIVLIIGIVWLSGNSDEIYRDKWIAVLPFDPITRALEDTIFCDGFHDALITQLQKIGDLHPLSRSTMLTYRNSGKRSTEIARELGVKHIVEASVQRAGNRLLINVQLIDGTNDDHIWAEEYEEEYSDIFAVRRKVAKEVARECKINISPEEQKALEYIPTKNLEAFDYYTKGKWYWDTKSSKEGNIKAAEMLEKAVSLDSSFALAYAKLSIVHSALCFTFGLGESSKTKAKSALIRAEQLDSDLSEVHAANGKYLSLCERDYDSAIEEINKALAIAPDNSEYNVLKARTLRFQDKFDEALVYSFKAYELDPISMHSLWDISGMYITLNNWIEADKYTNLLISKHPEVNDGYALKSKIYLSGYGQIHKARSILDEGWELAENRNYLIGYQYRVEIYARDYEAALKIIERNPESTGYPWRRAFIFYLMGKKGEANIVYDSLRVELERWIESNPDNAWNYANLGFIYAQLGRKEDAIRECMKADVLLPDNMYIKETFCDIYIMTSEHDKAIEILKESVDVPGSGVRLWDLKLNPFYDSLRDDPRFQELIK